MPAPEPEPEPADILELTEAMRAPEPEPSGMPFTTVDAQPDIVFSEDPADPEPEPEMPEPAMVMAEAPVDDSLEDARQTLSEQMEMDRPLLSRSATVAVDSAFASLTHTVLSQNARTLDDLVKDMLRPMLKAWLDDNLPGLVERLVRAEIERVSRGR
jgi:cell pole-organizing protein PopZ